MHRRLVVRAALLAALGSLAPLTAQSPRPLPALEQATQIHDTAASATRSWPELITEIAKRDVVFLGETHVDDTTHQVELRVLEELLRARQGKVVLSMEMFERDVQPVLDDYLAGRIDEGEFLQKARPWQNYRTAYRPLVEAAKAAKIPVIAANFPGSLRRAFAGGGGKAALDKLTAEQRALLPAEIFPASAQYWERVERAVRGHMGGGGSGTPEERLYDTQNLWDNAMGDAVAQALAKHAGSLVLHVAGGFHVAYRDGTVAQFQRRAKDRTFAVVSIAPTAELHTVRPDRDREQAAFLVYARTLARDFNEGNYAVEVPAELRYRLEVPDQGTNWPLLVWLPDRGTRVEDALAMWQMQVGDGAAVVVVEQPFPEVQSDLALGGRYAFGDGFRADYSRTSHGLSRIVEYVTRRFPVDAQRIVVAGQGDGGAAVLWTALYGEWLPHDFVAVAPTDTKRLGMEALPDQKPVAKSLRLVGAADATSTLEAIAADYRKVGTPAEVATQDGAALAASVRAQLGLRAMPAAANADEPLLLVLPNDSPRARDWAQLMVAMAAMQGTAVRLCTAAELPADAPASRVRRLQVGGSGLWPAETFASGRGLPLAGGPFGGTTVVVLPKGTSDDDKATWLQHEQKKVLKRRNMFANIAVACEDGEPSLPQLVTKLKGMGRSRLLIVPATFCADAATMQALRQQLGAAADGMDVAWLPGLGGELATLPPSGR
ncbi:MAG: ChaN family lipoprotein [Planctomycetota bacterium]